MWFYYFFSVLLKGCVAMIRDFKIAMDYGRYSHFLLMSCAFNVTALPKFYYKYEAGGVAQ